MFSNRRKKVHKEYDRAKSYPVIRGSICTGEKVAGFKDRESGHFEEVMCIRDEKELQEFIDTYGLQPGDIKKEW